MGLFDLFQKPDMVQAVRPNVSIEKAEPAITRPPAKVQAMHEGPVEVIGPTDPRLLKLMEGGVTGSGIAVTAKSALRNPTVFRCTSLLAYSIGMLPLHLQEKNTKRIATEHPLHRILHRRPNSWQTAFEFRSLMEQLALTKGDAVALKVKSRGQIIGLVPLMNVQISQRADWSLKYSVVRKDGKRVIYEQADVFHLRNGLSEDGFTGLSCVKQAAEAIGIAMQAEQSTAKLFANGMIIGGVFKHPTKLSPEAYTRLKESMNAGGGTENAGRWKIAEEGMDVIPFNAPGKEGQGLENRAHQIEEIARVFGVPRPLLMMDDTSWGSGIDVLGQLFVRYGLNPWFEAWQQAIERDLLTERETDLYAAKFNAGGLLRGSMKDQAEFFAKGLGSGGHQPWLHTDEVRDWQDLPRRDDLPAPPGNHNNGGGNDPANSS